MVKVLTAARVGALILCTLLFTFHHSIFIQAQEGVAPASDSTQLTLDLRRKTFDKVWQIVSDKYYDPNFKGTDWNAVRTKYLPEVEKTSDRVAFHGMLNRMLDEIKESHLSVNLPTNPQTGVGLERLIWAENKIFVKKVEADSPASQAKIQVGDEITAVDGLPVEEIFRQSVSGMTFVAPELRAQQRPFTVERKLRGAPNTTVTVRIRDRRDQLRELVLKREAKIEHGKIEPASFRKLTPSVGYLQIPSYWWGNLGETFDKAFAQFAGSKSLIVDVRGNSGGQVPLLVDFVGRLMERDGNLGNLVYRNKKEALVFKGTGEKAFKGKVVVLIDENSASASEILAGGLKDLGRATVVGNRSGGAVILSLIEPLPTGGSILYPIADLFTPRGYRIEGNGVQPDVEVKRTRRGLIEGRDPALEKALAIAARD